MNYSGLTRRSLLSRVIAASSLPFVSAQQENPSEENYYIGFPLELNWESKIDYDAGDVGGKINQTVFVGMSNFGNSNGKLAALDIDSGRRMWSIDLPSVVGTPYTDEKTVFVTGRNNIYSIDPNAGSKIWEVEFAQGQPLPYLSIQDNYIFAAGRGFKNRKNSDGFRVTPGELMCLRKDNGKNKWSKSGKPVVGMDTKNEKIFATIAEEKYTSELDIIESDGSIHAYNQKSGELLWNTGDYSLTGYPQAGESHLVGIGKDGTIYGFDYSDGQKRWDLSVSNNQLNSTMISNLLYIGYDDGVTLAVDMGNQSIVWKNKYDRAVQWMNKKKSNNILYLGSSNGSIRAVDSRSGQTVWSHTLPTTAAPLITIHNDTAFFSGEMDSVYTFAGQRAIAQKNISRVKNMSTSSVVNTFEEISGQESSLSLAKSAFDNREYENAQKFAEETERKIQNIETSGAFLGGIGVLGGAVVAIKKAKEQAHRKSVQQDYDEAIQRANDINESVDFDIEIESRMREASPTNYDSINEAEKAVSDFNNYLQDTSEAIRQHSKIEQRIKSLFEKDEPIDINVSTTEAIEIISRGDPPGEAKEKLEEVSLFLDCYEIKSSLNIRLDSIQNTNIDLETDTLQQNIAEIDINDNPSQAINMLNSYEKTVDMVERINKLYGWNSSLPLRGVITGLNRKINNKKVDENSIQQKIKDFEQIKTSAENVINFVEQIDEDYPHIDINETLESLNDAISNGDVEKIDSLERNIDDIINTTWVSEDLFQYDWESFEHLVSRLWSDMGYSTTVTQASSDRGIDVVAKNNKETVLIQVKQNSTGNNVGRPTVQKTAGVLSGDNADRAIIVSSASYTNTAIEEAKRHGKKIELISGQQLLNMLSDSRLPPPE